MGPAFPRWRKAGPIEPGKLLISVEIRFANGIPLAPPSPPRSGGEGHACWLLLGRPVEALWDKDNPDQVRADRMPVGSSLADRLRICGTRISQIKDEPLEFAPSPLLRERVGVRVAVDLVGISGCRVSWNSESC